MGRLTQAGYTGNMVPISFRISLSLLILSLTCAVFTVQADSDQEEARRLLESGDIMSLEMILKKLRPEFTGKILEAELESEPGQIVYEIELLGNDGIVRELNIDARTGELLGVERED